MRSLLLFAKVFLFVIVKAQYPSYFNYSGASGLPSDEVYSILQDKYGFIWIGCDAGLYKFDGIRYHAYKSNKQTSKSLTGLTISKNGNIYCYNFNSQVFVLKDDTLREIYAKPPVTITGISSDSCGKLYVSHSAGIDVYDENTNLWKKYSSDNLELSISKNNYVCKLANTNPLSGAYFLSSSGIGCIADNTYSITPFKIFTNYSPGSFILEYYHNEIWIFKAENRLVFRYGKQALNEVNSKNLLSVLGNRKITNVKALADGNLWICTYNGIISYNAQKDISELYYPDKAFSGCLIDREGNYWMTTLQDGIIRIPNMNMRLWNSENKLVLDDKISRIFKNKDAIYFASNKGAVAELSVKTSAIKYFPTEISGDVQSFDFDEESGKLKFNINNKLYEWTKDKLTSKVSEIKAIKAYKELNDNVFIGSSHGFFINDSAYNRNWVREIFIPRTKNQIWIATNKGLFQYQNDKNSWSEKRVYFKGVQVASITMDTLNCELIVMTFNGHLHSLDSTGKIKFITKLPSEIVPYKLAVYSQKGYYVATNKGLWIYNVNQNKWINLNRLAGVAADNVKDLALDEKEIWLATGNGLQLIPYVNADAGKKAIVYVKNLMVDQKKIKDFSKIQMDYKQQLFIFPEASIYRSNGEFLYAYRLKGTDTSWFTLPSDIQRIQITNIPSGNFEIELKVIDHNGNSSENTIILSGYSNPPYWRTWWFVSVLSLLLICSIIIFFKLRILRLKSAQLKEIKRIKIENELRLSRETALKSQMNPHFVFNVLNSIKSYIYKNDKQKANIYLNEFSNLIRTFLNMSNSSSITIAEELKMLKTYISLESMMLGGEFIFDQDVDESVDQSSSKIPSLLIQPFIENAFKHGLQHRPGLKKLALKVKKIGSYLIITIEDNGVGREESAKINAHSNSQHASFAGDAIKKRIELINRDEEIVCITFTDLFENKKATGTLVTIKIKIDEPI